eukprot:scaffold1307_cov87-Phaeocystis_antarctica.AAC.6
MSRWSSRAASSACGREAHSRGLASMIRQSALGWSVRSMLPLRGRAGGLAPRRAARLLRIWALPHVSAGTPPAVGTNF